MTRLGFLTRQRHAAAGAHIMTRLGFLLDSDSCIHACTVACKSEHEVPLGVNRTWVKYIETGSFPNVSRHFSVMRCNHCDDAPCITICPTKALFRADNGVVDFDDSNCIGCKGCMNACPYDAIYINPETNTANKCNFCNHRVEQNLEPSCVVVCPTNAIRVADLDDPNDETTKIIARSDTAVRAPQQQTLPKVYYRGADQASLDPLRTAIAADGMIWADTTAQHPTADPEGHGVVARTAYTTAHQMTWKAKVSTYLVTKAISAGVMIVAALLALSGHSDSQAAVAVMPPVVAGVFLAVTGVLLVADLRRPERFYYLLTRGNRRSWLVKGAWVLGAFAAVCAAWFVAGVAGSFGAVSALSVPAALLAAATAGYTALLFGQCEGRDLWQTPLLLPTLLAQAAVAGGGCLLRRRPRHGCAGADLGSLGDARRASRQRSADHSRSGIQGHRSRRGRSGRHDPRPLRPPLLGRRNPARSRSAGHGDRDSPGRRRRCAAARGRRRRGRRRHVVLRGQLRARWPERPAVLDPKTTSPHHQTPRPPVHITEAAASSASRTTPSPTPAPTP